MNSRLLAAALLTSMTLSAGCVRRTVTQDFGLSRINTPRAKLPTPPSPDANLRAIFKNQIVVNDQGVETLLARVQDNPEDVAARLELGLLYEHLNDLAASQRAFEEALALNPESDRVHNNLGY